MRLICILIILWNGNYCLAQEQQQPIMTGITMVAPPSPIGNAEIQEISAISANWIALVPYGFMTAAGTEIRYNLDRQWWGEKKVGIIKSIELAHTAGLKVMLKPQVYIHGHWVGDVQFDSESEWESWESSYRSYLRFYLDLAIAHDVEMLCIGTEWKQSVKQRPEFWKTIIADIRSEYKGKLIYCSNWDSYTEVPFWDDLDYVGISGYFPLSSRKTPTVHQLKAAWLPTKKNLRKLYKKHKKPIVFAEYGYMSIDGCAGKAWLIEKDIPNREVNEVAQARSYDALWAAHTGEKYWAGGFLWKWFPAGMGHEGYPEKDYTPQNKKSYDVIKKWHQKANKADHHSIK